MQARSVLNEIYQTLFASLSYDLLFCSLCIRIYGCLCWRKWKQRQGLHLKNIWIPFVKLGQQRTAHCWDVTLYNLQNFADVSEEFTTSIFRIQEQGKSDYTASTTVRPRLHLHSLSLLLVLVIARLLLRFWDGATLSSDVSVNFYQITWRRPRKSYSNPK